MNYKIDILIIGGGPTGLLLANLLGQAGVKTLLLEQAVSVYPIPRATHIDEETLRNFQLTGLFCSFVKYTSSFGNALVTDKKGRILFKEEIIQENSIHLFKGSRFFDQPGFESILWQGLKRYDCVEVITGCKALDFEQNETEVKVLAKQINNTQCQFTANYVVACDGGSSLIRSGLKITMQQLEPAREWIIVDTLLKHEDYSKLLPTNFQYIFNPKRLTIFAYGYGLNRRWEFQLHKNEAMPTDEEIKSWVAEFIDLDKMVIIRIAKYAHHSLVAEKWKAQRIFLAGDAAHMMPPAAGQGLCSGIRDAVNLAWKLALVVNKNANNNLLVTYQQERKPHLQDILRRTLFFSKKVNADNTLQKVWRHMSISAIEKMPFLKSYLRKKYNTPALLIKSYISNGKMAGMHLPQFLLSSGMISDDLIGYRFVLICKHEMVSRIDLKLLQELGIFLLNEKLATDENAFQNFLSENDIDFAIVRPDKIIFNTGKIETYGKVLQTFNEAFFKS
jgi:3-(3-hydroxy-phenyl)propionate hydroxylase